MLQLQPRRISAGFPRKTAKCSSRKSALLFDAEYKTDEAKGFLTSYIMTDRGEDDLGRYRKNIDPNKDIRLEAIFEENDHG